MNLSKKNPILIGLLTAGFGQFGAVQDRANKINKLLDQSEVYLENYEFEKTPAFCDEAMLKKLGGK